MVIQVETIKPRLELPIKREDRKNKNANKLIKNNSIKRDEPGSVK